MIQSSKRNKDLATGVDTRRHPEQFCKSRMISSGSRVHPRLGFWLDGRSMMESFESPLLSEIARLISMEHHLLACGIEFHHKAGHPAVARLGVFLSRGLGLTFVGNGDSHCLMSDDSPRGFFPDRTDPRHKV